MHTPELIERASLRVALASRAIEEAAADLFRAGREGAPLGDAGMRLEHEATRVGLLAGETAALRVTLTVDPAGRE
ncbi:MAG TPA: hypothetical protein VK721_06155 [Solirubrobacteraceae bacterium]|jgi:hypothetical protein|nr:hypothetical protein [Solirubrobacteraceae bacterium]